jgi:hypothetical protein
MTTPQHPTASRTSLKRQSVIDMTSAPATARVIDPLDTTPLFEVNDPLTSSGPAVAHDVLAGLAAIRDSRRHLDQHEHELITKARAIGATWQQIAASLGFKDRQTAQQRHQALTRTLAHQPNSSRTRTRQP